MASLRACGARRYAWMRGGGAFGLGRLVAACRVLLLGLRLHRRTRMGKGRPGDGERPGRMAQDNGMLPGLATRTGAGIGGEGQAGRDEAGPGWTEEVVEGVARLGRLVALLPSSDAMGALESAPPTLPAVVFAPPLTPSPAPPGLNLPRATRSGSKGAGRARHTVTRLPAA